MRKKPQLELQGFRFKSRGRIGLQEFEMACDLIDDTNGSWSDSENGCAASSDLSSTTASPEFVSSVPASYSVLNGKVTHAS